MWCAKYGVLAEIESLLSEYVKDAHFNADQEFLSNIIWPRVEHVTLHHASFGCEKWSATKTFAVPRVGLEHVGAVYIDNLMRPEDLNILREAIASGQECPMSTQA